jgi:hypothetical protein
LEEEIIQEQKKLIKKKKQLEGMIGKSLPPNEIDNIQFKPL